MIFLKLDTAYGRLRIDAIRDETIPEGFKLKISPQRAELDKNALVSQDVAVTLSVDEIGRIVSGKPLKLDQFVPIKWDENYHREVLNKVLANIR